MTTPLDITLLQAHISSLASLLRTDRGVEAAGYLYFGVSRIESDPWEECPRLRLVSHRVQEIEPSDKIGASGLHVTWSTRGFMRMLSAAKASGLIPGIVHTHPGSRAFFSPQDDSNEAELARTAGIKGTAGLVSLVFGGDGSVCGRLWLPDGSFKVARSVQSVGGRFRRWLSGIDPCTSSDHLDRQARLFGSQFNPTIRSLKVAVVGCGGTGSAVAMLLARLGVGQLLLIDKDFVELTNLNRVHGARRTDAENRIAKVEMLKREIEAAGLGVQVIIHKGWVNDESIRDGIKSCDFVFGCTDDHSGRITLNRLSYFYGIPVIDVGLRMMPWKSNGGHDINGRVTTLCPGHPCLLCGGIVSGKRAAEESLERSDPQEFEKQKLEAYVVEGGDPAPAVVSFTTEMACVAVNEMIAAITGFQGAEGMVPTRYRRFHVRDERFLAVTKVGSCQVCSVSTNWGLADVDPFLDLIR
ncbi:MAG: UBA/THIF-type binding protein [Planctomycetaceae bacterium]|nr:UBA/THIF-type binding protein [Planctomycetaceae bacterium]